MTDEQQLDMLERLVRIEAKLDNGIVKEIYGLKDWWKEWTSVHPQKCPLVERKTAIWNPILTGVIVGGVVLVADVLVKVVLG